MVKRSAFVLSAIFLLVGCSSMKISDFANSRPPLVLEQYFAGHTQAWGLFEDRFGKVRRQFTVDITGDWNGERLVLDEHFLYNDGETDQRIWTIRKTAEGRYEGTAGDVVGTAEGNSAGNALNWAYVMDLKMGDGNPAGVVRRLDVPAAGRHGRSTGPVSQTGRRAGLGHPVLRQAGRESRLLIRRMAAPRMGARP